MSGCRLGTFLFLTKLSGWGQILKIGRNLGKMKLEEIFTIQNIIIYLVIGKILFDFGKIKNQIIKAEV